MILVVIGDISAYVMEKLSGLQRIWLYAEICVGVHFFPEQPGSFRNTGHTQNNGAFQKLVIYFSPYSGTTYTVSSGNCPSFSCPTSSSLFVLTGGTRDQFPSWRGSERSVCSVLRCPDVITMQRKFRAQ
jgi:hypothetical protein